MHACMHACMMFLLPLHVVRLLFIDLVVGMITVITVAITLKLAGVSPQEHKQHLVFGS